MSFEGKTIRFYKRVQILVADLWACFGGESYGRFEDIDEITMFAGMGSGIRLDLALDNSCRLSSPTNASHSGMPQIQSSSRPPYPSASANQKRGHLGS